MISVRIKLLATYREHLPEGTKGGVVEIEHKEGVSLEDALKPFNLPLDSSSVVLVNGRTEGLAYILKDNDEVCVFPAMAGG